MSVTRALCTGPKEAPHGPVIYVRWALNPDGPIEGGCPVCSAVKASAAVLSGILLRQVMPGAQGKEGGADSA